MSLRNVYICGGQHRLQIGPPTCSSQISERWPISTVFRPRLEASLSFWNKNEWETKYTDDIQHTIATASFAVHMVWDMQDQMIRHGLPLYLELSAFNTQTHLINIESQSHSCIVCDDVILWQSIHGMGWMFRAKHSTHPEEVEC